MVLMASASELTASGPDEGRTECPLWGAYARQRVGKDEAMELREWRRALRIAAGAGDGAAVVALTRDFPDECLQEVGTALLRSAIQQALGAAEVIGACSVALRSRRWAGDEELARELDGILGAGPGSDLVPVNVALDDLGEALQGPAGSDRAIVDLETGQVWTAEAIEYSLDAGLDDVPVDPDGHRWIEVWPVPHGFDDMRAFTATVADPALAEMLERATSGPKSYRRFRDLLERSPSEASRWHAFSDDRQLGRARAWLAAAGYRSDIRGA